MNKRYLNHKSGVLAGLFVLFLFTELSETRGQEEQEKTVDHQFWFSSILHHQQSRDLEIYGYLDYRTMVAWDDWDCFRGRIALAKTTRRGFDFHAGLSVIYDFNEIKYDRFETRFWQGLKYYWPDRRDFRLRHFAQIEERISFYTESNSSDVEPWQPSFSARLRYRLTWQYVFPRQSRHAYFYLPVSAELFFPLMDGFEEVFRNTNQSGVGLGYRLGESWDFVTFVYWQSKRRDPTTEFDKSSMIYEFKLHYYLN